MASFVFRNFNGIYQLRLEKAEDLDLIHELEEAAWRATSAPLEQLYCDPRFLEALDTDKNGRVRVDEVKAAHLWLKKQLADRSGVVARSDTLKLAALDAKSADVPGMKSLADRIIRERAGGVPGEVSLAEVRAFQAGYKKKFPNGDGVLTEAQLTDASLKPVFAKVLEATQGAADLSGDKGVRAVDVDAFLALAKKYVDWAAEARPAGTAADAPTAVEPLLGGTAAAAALVADLAPKIEQFFALCDLVALEAQATARLTATPEMLAALDTKNTQAVRAWVEGAPIASPTKEAVLDLGGALNPHYAARLASLKNDVLPKLSLSPRLSRADWEKLKATLAPQQDWQARKPGGVPAGLGVPELKAFLEGKEAAALRELCVQDEHASSELKELNSLEKLILLQRNFVDLVNNFVSFPRLFIPGERSLFETGTLILDGRAMSLCVHVSDRGGHKKVAEQSQMFIVYAELTRKEGDQVQTKQIAAAVTAGTRGGITAGKRGVFYDREKREWDAQVVDVIVAPISLYEAAVSPFVRLKNFVATRIEKMTASKLDAAEADLTKQTEKGVDTAAALPAAAAAATPAPPAAPAAKPAAPPPAPAPQGGGGALGNLVLGGSVAIAAIGSTLAFVTKTVSEMDPLRAALGLLSVVVVVAGLSGFLGWLKLRRRDLSTLLEACGWALNGRMYLTRRLSLLFTQEPDLPGEGSSTEIPQITSRHIVAAEKKRARRQRRFIFRLLLLVLLVAAVYYRQELWALIQAQLNPGQG